MKPIEASILTDAVKAAINAAHVTTAELIRHSHVDRAQLNRFMRGERTLTLESADRLLTALGCKLTIGPPREDGRLTMTKPGEQKLRKAKQIKKGRK